MDLRSLAIAMPAIAARPSLRWLRALAALTLLATLAIALTPAVVGALALGAALVARARTPGAVENLACLLAMAVMFGLSGAGAFALFAALSSWPLIASLGGVRRPTALALACLTAGACCALALPLAFALPEHWAPFAAMAPALAAALPRRPLERTAAAALGARATKWRLNALPMLVIAMICGGALAGIAGAAAAWAIGRLATPVAMLLLAGRERMACAALGALAAGLAGAAGAAAAILSGSTTFAAVAALVTAFLGLRVHAPAAAGRLLSPSALWPALLPARPGPGLASSGLFPRRARSGSAT